MSADRYLKKGVTGDDDPTRGDEPVPDGSAPPDGGGGDGAPLPGLDDGRRRLTLQAALERARNLAKYDSQGTQELMLDCVRAGFTAGELKMVEEVASNSTEWTTGVISMVIKDARSHRDGHGVLPDKLRVSTAVTKEWERTYTGVVFADGAPYFYIADDHPHAAEVPMEEKGYWRRANVEEVDEYVRGFTAGSPVVASEAARREVRDTAYSILAKPDWFEGAPAGVNVANGFVRWNEVEGRIELLPHSPDHRARVKLAFDYDPDATSPTYIGGLERVLPEPDRQLAMQELVAAVLFRLRLPRDSARAAVILVGEARTGKTTMIEVLESFYPAEAIGHEPPTGWGSEYNRAELAGKLLNTVTELSSGKVLKSDIFKLIVSAETFKARYPRERPFKARMDGHHLFACNALASVDDESEGFGRRLTVIRFDHPIPVEEISGDFLRVVRRDELAGVLNWAAEAIPGMLARGYFALPACHAEGLLHMRHPNDHVAWAAHFHVENAPGERIYNGELKALLRRLHEAMGLGGEADGNGEMRRLSAWLKKLYGSERSASNRDPFYQNVRLRRGPPGPAAEDGWPVSPAGPDGGGDDWPRRVAADALDEEFDTELELADEEA